MAFGVVLAAIIGVATLLHEIEPPDPGDFYDPPPEVAVASPGEVLRSEPLDIEVDGADGWLVLYRSTDRNGEPNAVSGVVIAPEGPAPPQGRPVVAWAHPTTGVDRRCAPSLRNRPSRSMHGVQEAIDAGWVWAATDYPGLGTPGPHAYLIGNSEAHATLDSVRAARNLGTGATEQVGLWGHSQGGHAVLWSAILAAEYAPEMQIVGVATAAPAIELAELVEADEDTLRGNLLLSFAIAAWSDLYPGADIDRIVEPTSRPLVEDAAENCIETLAEALTVAPEATAEIMVPFLSADPVTTEPWSDLMAVNTPDGPIHAPIFIGQGREDRIVRPDTTEQAARSRCGAGEVVELRSFGQLGHTDAGERIAPYAMEWMADRFAGDRAPSSCPTLAR